MLSSRGTKNVGLFDIPWRYSKLQTYDKETNPDGLISFALAENVPMRNEIAKYVNEKVTLTTDSVSYTMTPATAMRLPTALAAHLNRNFRPYEPVDPGHIIVSSSPTALGGILGFTVAEPGDGILVSRPIYGRFELDYGVEAGVEMVYAETEPEDSFLPAVIDKYEAALTDAERRGQRIRALLLVNPHNPIGRCYPIDTLKAILGFCQRHQLHFISDEVYAMCVFDSGSRNAVPFTSILALNLSEFINSNLVHVLYSFSKDFAAGGLRLGFLISRNEDLLRACKGILRLHGASSAAVEIGTAILEDESFVSSFLGRARRRLASSYQLVTSILDREGIRYVKGGNAGFFVYMDLSPYLPSKSYLTDQEREFSLAQKFYDAGIFLHPGEEHSKDPGWFRLVFTQEDDVLLEGLRRMIKVLKGVARL
ncbi:Pyridoxal phosphate-dependent transferase [Elaphomyces granulatus]|jgi:aspartate/methionine/tyrosine aminotransferase